MAATLIASLATILINKVYFQFEGRNGLLLKYLSKHISTVPDWLKDPMDPRWIGAWWLGYVGLGVVYLLPAMIFACLSRRSVNLKDKDLIVVDRYFNKRDKSSLVVNYLRAHRESEHISVVADPIAGLASIMCTSAFVLILCARVFTTMAEVATEQIHVSPLFGRSSLGNKGEEMKNSFVCDHFLLKNLGCKVVQTSTVSTCSNSVVCGCVHRLRTRPHRHPCIVAELAPRRTHDRHHESAGGCAVR